MNDNAAVCVNCGVAVGTGGSYCNTCGAETNPASVVCVKCGCQLMVPGAAKSEEVVEYSEKSKLTAGLLGIFLGAIGVHSFYLKDTKKGVIHLVLALGGIICMLIPTIASWIWGLVEGIMLLCSKDAKDGEGKLLK